ncbi:hypothetical protein [Pseudarthrobacter sp. S9]|uniref:hypothetical protein n=1 Tax=Pseudarthrobacter sp. S9 TaxID=3418421 RepID=UPI003CFEEB8C
MVDVCTACGSKITYRTTKVMDYDHEGIPEFQKIPDKCSNSKCPNAGPELDAWSDWYTTIAGQV